MSDTARALLPASLVLAIAACSGAALAVALGAANSSAPAAAAAGRCVGMFIAAPGTGPVPSTIAADASNLTVRGNVPCAASVAGWAPQGAYRVFEDGTVEFLAVPVPPCPGGDFYAWIAFPK